MKQEILFVSCLLTVACGGGSHITEVGNPSTSATTTVTTQALSQVLVDTLVTEESDLPSRVALNATDDDAECTTSEDGLTESCPCTGSGTMTITFGTDINVDLPTSNNVVITMPYTLSFNACTDTACSETIELDGVLNGTVSISYTVSNDSFDNYTATLSSTESCSGLNANGSPFGLDITETLNGNGDLETFSGSFCINDTPITFDSLEDLEAQVDPANECSETSS